MLLVDFWKRISSPHLDTNNSLNNNNFPQHDFHISPTTLSRNIVARTESVTENVWEENTSLEYFLNFKPDPAAIQQQLQQQQQLQLLREHQPLSITQSLALRCIEMYQSKQQQQQQPQQQENMGEEWYGNAGEVGKESEKKNFLYESLTVLGIIFVIAVVCDLL